MSKIVAAFSPPVFPEDYEPPEGAQWWRFDLRHSRDADGNYMITTVDGDWPDREPTWICYEFFDGEQDVIDAGLDRPTPVVLHTECAGGHIDVLHVGPPTKSPMWERRYRGCWPHPESGLRGKQLRQTVTTLREIGGF